MRPARIASATGCGIVWNWKRFLASSSLLFTELYLTPSRSAASSIVVPTVIQLRYAASFGSSQAGCCAVGVRGSRVVRV